MINRDQILKLMRDKVTHPATPRELLHTLRIPQDERTTFRRLLKALVTSGEPVLRQSALLERLHRNLRVLAEREPSAAA